MGGTGWAVAGRCKRKGTYVNLWLIHAVVQLKAIQHRKAVILQLKRNLKEKPRPRLLLLCVPPVMPTVRELKFGLTKSFNNTVSPLYLWVPPLQIQPITDEHIWKKISESSKMCNLNLRHTSNYLHCIYNYSRSIYIVLVIVSNLEMIWRTCRCA